MSQTRMGPDNGSGYHTPRWVKVFGVIVIVLVLLTGIILLVDGGEHGPGRHIPSGDTGGYTTPIERGAQRIWQPAWKQTFS